VPEPAAGSQLRYDRPAPDWLSALPLGNGRLGAMCWGGPEGERIGLNHELAWSGPVGGPIRTTRPDAPARVAQARERVRAGEYHAAEDLLRSVAVPHSQAYLPVGELFVDCRPENTAAPHVYERGLDLTTASAWVDRRWGSGHVRQETRASFPADALLHSAFGDLGFGIEISLDTPLRIVDVRTDQEGGLARLAVRLELPWDVAPWSPDQADPVRWGPAGSERTREVVLCLLLSTDGQVEPGPDRLRVRGAGWAEIVLTGEVTGSPLDRRKVASRARRGEQAANRAQARARRAIELGPARLIAEHEADIASLEHGFSLELDGELDGRTTDVVAADPRRTPAAERALVELLVRYARYLLVAGSRPGTLPLTLQGLWNAELQPPWSSNYTLNINLPMAYWAAEAWGLGDCHLPLFDLIDRLTVTGERAAREVYGLPGWTVHHNTDLWAEARPVGGGWIDPAWSSWPLGAAWLGRHLIEHLQHASDPLAVAARARPVLAGAVRFVLGWLVEQPDGSLGTVPSTSPENRWITPDGTTTGVGVSSTADLALITGLLQGYLATLAPGPAESEVKAALVRIPQPGIGRDGELLEWLDDVPEAEPEHRHTSHLVGLYPLDLVDLDRTPDLARAVARTLERRGDESTGWALAWRVCLWARLRRPDKVADLVSRALRPAVADGVQRGGLYPNLFSAHPPFQIDGNLGLAAGVLEALVQSRDHEIRLLPALPVDWSEGRVTGVRTRAGVVVDLTWVAGRPVAVILRALRPTTVTLRFAGWAHDLDPIELRPGECWSLPLSVLGDHATGPA
jgi:alpha-L-fucosidase 2